MAGLYIHIPFCSKRCLYCDFFSSTDLHFQKPFINALIREMELRQNYLKQEPLETVYFGGGTPSLLPPETFNRLFDAIERLFGLGQCKEITLEANPDDLTPDYVAALRDLPFNRISMGIQSFQDKDLVFLNRRHTCRQAIQAVERCQANGLEEISIDLIYGLPGQTQTEWENNLEEALKLAVPHISAYHLTYEEGTALYKLLAAGKITPAGEEQSVSFFATLIDRLTASGYQHYEISNFALSGHHARHNSSYWNGPSEFRTGRVGRAYALQRVCHHPTAHDVGNPDGRRAATIRSGKTGLSQAAGGRLYSPRAAQRFGRHAYAFPERNIHFRRNHERSFMGVKAA